MTTETANTGSLLTTEQAAALLSVKPETLASWRCLGRYDLPFVHVGRAVRYDRADLETWKSARRTTAVARKAN